MTRITMIEAVKDAEAATGKTAVAANFVASERGEVVAYQVALASPSGDQSSVVIDARSGNRITDVAAEALTN